MTWLFTLPTPKDATSMVNEAALRANNKVGPGIGPIHGTKVHTAMSQEINELGNIELNSEISYLDGEIVKYGTPGSIRVDVVYGPIKDPISIFDLKTGNAILTNDRILQIQRQLPRLDIPIIEIK